ncbi:MarR family winged helix-turn-helix transcriptional regulator [Nocardioides sp. Kera G14]|uniref:MarR family winged helix-turn-helix transcriptional regulator n=1 Tax=Nocardioides sp. Kera G14 TaxID=2884264 RepID=UPI002AB17EAA|nr:MarR family transcriptional regulator [Nocardioides sp. Kera G14]
MSEPTYPQLQLDAQLCFPLYAATRAVTREYARLLAGTGLTYPQYLVMLVLWEAGEPMSVTEVGARLRLDSGTLTPLLKRLEVTGLVSRRRDTEDERRVLVEVTETGMAVREQVVDVPTRLGKAMRMTHAEALRLRDELTALIENLDRQM